jgi:hypothetical protein
MRLTSAENAQLKYGERKMGNEADSSVFRRRVECFVFVGVRFLAHWVFCQMP